MIQTAMLLIVGSLVLLGVTICTEGWAWLQYRCYGESCEALVWDEISFTLDCSRGTVEQQAEDGSFQRILSTGDRSVGQLPFYHILFEKGKYQYIFEWQANGRVWHGHYPFLKKKGTWKIGDKVKLRYRAVKPWNYSVEDEQIWRTFLWKCLLGVMLFFCGILILAFAV